MSGGISFAGRSDVRDVVGRDHITHNYYARHIREGVETWVVKKQLLAELAALYVVPTPVFGDALGRLQDRRVVVLHGRPHWGKRFTALCLLHELTRHDDGAEIQRLDQDEDLLSLGPKTLKRGCGYIVDTLAPEHAGRLTDDRLDRLSEDLREFSGYLAITIDLRTVSRRLIAADYLIECEEPPDAVEVLRRHLDALPGGPECTELISRQEIVDFLQTKPLPRDVVQLAKDLAGAAREDRVDALLSRLSDHVSKDVEEWFQQHTDRADRAFMLALAVFNGETYQNVLDGADRLDSRLQQIAAPDSDGGRPVFGTGKSEQLARARARRLSSWEHRSVGSLPVEIVEFENPRMASAVLDFVWDEYGDTRRAVLDWLSDLAADPDIRLRARAAMAIGRLSLTGFGHIHDEILSRWAGSKVYRLRQSVAWMLAIPAEDATIAPAVRALLRDWADPDSNRWRKLTAANAYGSYVGQLFPDAALSGLRRIADYPVDEGIGRAVSYSMASLFEAGYEREVVEALVEWTAADDQPRERLAHSGRIEIGLRSFMWIAELATVEPPPEGQPWPALLALTENDPGAVADVATLLRRADRAKTLGAINALKAWTHQADKDWRLVDLIWPVVQVFTDVAHREQRLRFYLEKWADDAKEPSRAAVTLLEKLQERGCAHGGR